MVHFTQQHTLYTQHLNNNSSLCMTSSGGGGGERVALQLLPDLFSLNIIFFFYLGFVAILSLHLLNNSGEAMSELVVVQ